MLNTAIVGLGWWGKTLVRAVQGKGDIQVVTGGPFDAAHADRIVLLSATGITPYTHEDHSTASR